MKGDEQSNGSRVLVTGGAGFIGANLIRVLLNRGYRVSVLDDLSVGRREYLEGLPIELITGDILDAELVNRVVTACDSVVHLAAQTGVPGSLADPRRDCEVNVVGTLNVLEACRHAMAHRQSVKPDPRAGASPRFIFASSNAPLGRQEPPATEDKAPLPVSPYGASKLAGEAYCLAYHSAWGLGTLALRFGNVYGPFSSDKNSVVAKFFKDILTKGQITIEGDGQQTRDFVHVDDLCRALLKALESNVSGEVFQIATGVETSIRELAALACEVAGGPIRVSYEEGRRGDVRKNYSVIAKAHEMLKWSPEVELATGLRTTWGWLREWFSKGEDGHACSERTI